LFQPRSKLRKSEVQFQSEPDGARLHSCVNENLFGCGFSSQPAEEELVDWHAKV
jgi:hypothetical protein